MAHPNPLRVAVTNVTMGNGGDAAILLGLERALRAALPPFEMTIFETQPDVAVPYFPEYDIKMGLSSVAWTHIATGIPARARRAIRWLERRPRLIAAAKAHAAGHPRLARALAGADGAGPFDALADADIVVSTGGTYFVPAYWLGLRYMEFDVLHALGKPYALYTQSVGPTDTMPRARLAEIWGRSRVMLLRDERSLREVNQLAPEADASVHADAAFALADPEVLAAARTRTMPAGPTVAVSVRDWPHFTTTTGEEGMARYRASVADAVSHLVREHGATVRFLSTCQGKPGYRYDDAATAERIRQSLPADVAPHATVDDDPHSPTELIEAYRACDVVIATRMHAAIVALCAGTPVVPIAYEFKSEELLARLGHRDWSVDIETITGQMLIATLERVFDELPSARAGLFEGVERMRMDAMVSGQLVAEAFQGEIAPYL